MTHRYTVTWWKSAGRELTNAWLQSSDRRVFSQLIDGVDRELATTPENVG